MAELTSLLDPLTNDELVALLYLRYLERRRTVALPEGLLTWAGYRREFDEQLRLLADDERRYLIFSNLQSIESIDPYADDEVRPLLDTYRARIKELVSGR
jgi:hypothetical protein